MNQPPNEPTSESTSDAKEKELIEKAAKGDSGAIGNLLTRHSQRIKRMLAVRLDPRIRARLDESDVYQELQIEATRRLPEFLAERSVSFFVWMRYLAKQKLAELTRRHLQIQSRDPRREQRSFRSDRNASSIALASFLIGNVTSPSMQVAREEMKGIIENAIQSLDQIDREILLLRHAEHLSTAEAAVELTISANTCRQRYWRALKRLKSVLDQHQLDWGGMRGKSHNE